MVVKLYSRKIFWFFYGRPYENYSTYRNWFWMIKITMKRYKYHITFWCIIIFDSIICIISSQRESLQLFQYELLAQKDIHYHVQSLTFFEWNASFFSLQGIKWYKFIIIQFREWCRSSKTWIMILINNSLFCLVNERPDINLEYIVNVYISYCYFRSILDIATSEAHLRRSFKYIFFPQFQLCNFRCINHNEFLVQVSLIWDTA